MFRVKSNAPKNADERFHYWHESVRLILKELDPLGDEQRGRHSLTRRTYISTGPNHTWHIGGYNKFKPFGFVIHGAIGSYSWKVLWSSVGSSNNDPNAIVYYFINCVVDIQVLILQFNILEI